jgi:uncharacterized protein (DUF1800 family)
MAASAGSDATTQAVFALHRFGLGPRAGSLASMGGDPRGALIADISRPRAAQITAPDLPTSAEAARAAFEFREKRRQQRLAARAEPDAARPTRPGRDAAAPAPGPSAAPAGRDDVAGNDMASNNAARNDMANDAAASPPALAAGPRRARIDGVPPLPQQIFLREARARLDAALAADIGFAERLAWFWSNHFCISADKGPLRPVVGAYEREAIRPHVAGRFADMLQAVESHPGMLVYLDNARSIGPESIAGRNRGKGLNENLAREILELHTLGVRTVYTQTDVTRFAAVITGWTVVPPREPQGGAFIFNPRMHEPGAQTVLGKTYPDGELDQGKAVLATLARHPATARHVAAKLVRHFVSDEPVPALADKLAKRFMATDGDLKEVAIALVSAPEAWDTAHRKLKRPGEWIVAALRAVDVAPPEIGPVMQAQNLLGEPLWRPAAPKGFADEEATWIDGLAQRLDVSNELARRFAGRVDPAVAVETALGPLASDETRTAIRRAESRPQALTLLFMAPEFQRR